VKEFFMKNIISSLENAIFGHRRLVIGVFVLLAIFMGYSATHLKIDAGFKKLLPLEHEYMQTFVKHGKEFGGANRVLIALKAKDGDIYSKEFFQALGQATDEVFFIPGVDRSKVTSLFTPNVRFTEVTEEGFAGGKVVPADFQPTAEGLETVRKNVLKSNIIGRLVANDFSAAIISAELMEINPDTGERLNYLEVANRLEEVRTKFANDQIDVHIIGFAKFIGDMTDGAKRVVMFFAIAFLISAFLVRWYTQSTRATVVLLTCSVMAVVLQLGLLPLLGFGIDPMSILVPFLVFAIAISHGVQMIGATRSEVFLGSGSEEAARKSFRRLLIPGGIALASDTIGFITILLIKIQIIQEMAITASLGVAMIIFANLILLPVLLSYLSYNDAYKEKTRVRAARMKKIWDKVGRVAEPKPALIVLLVSAVLLTFAAWKGADIKIGDLERGVPELRAESRYNVDGRVISGHFSIGVDMISIIAETTPDACIEYDNMSEIDDFAWAMKNVPGVQSVTNLSGAAKMVNSGWNEGGLNWRMIPRNQTSLVQATRLIPSSSGLLNKDCSVMPLLIFTEDHKAETITRIVSAVKQYRSDNPSELVKFQLATGNVGVMAATNEEVDAAQFPILLYVFAAIIILCYLSFRSIRGVLCIVLPLGMVSMFGYALMTMNNIGLKVSTLPVVALGVGVGVDYGIYIYSRFKSFMDEGHDLQHAYHLTLETTGNAVIFTGITLAIGVATWIFSPLQFQADMGVLLTFMFLVNMLGAILVLPALACWMMRDKHK
jgi:predicted RND superfamily exporter protein